ncbi:MAG TPA: serine hydrolase [Candidatus Paceibacterota bacterium]|nr:serine hydrolase [Candidatus Paceibacterota bacterium]
MQKKITVLTIIIVGLVSVNAYFIVTDAKTQPISDTGPVFASTELYVKAPAPADYLPILDSSADRVKLDAKAAISFDIKADKNLYEKNIDQRLPVASLTKILNAIVSWENFDPNAIVSVEPDAVKVDGERQDLYVGEQISVNSLMQMMLIESSNDAANALADYAQTKGFDMVEAMNAKAAKLGMTNTHFIDPAGLNDSGYSTVHDLSKAVTYALRYSALWNFSREPSAIVTSADGKISHEVKATDQLLGVLSGIIGGKTGYTDGALGCMMLIVKIPDQQDTVVNVLIGSNQRFVDMQRLVDWVRTAYRWQ